jgi:hypothetical protein
MEPHFLATAPRRRRLEESSEFNSAVNAMSRRGTDPSAVVAAPPEPSFFETLAAFFTLPRLAGAAALLIAVIGGVYLLNRAGQDGATDAQFAQQPPRPTETPVIDPRPSFSPDNGTQPPEPEVAGTTPDSSNTTPRTSPSPKSEVAARPNPKRPKPISPNETRRDLQQKHVALDPKGHLDDRARFTIEGPSTSPRGTAREPSITLRAGATRDIGEGNTLTIPPGARSASLTLLFRSERYPRYIVTITTVEGTEVFRELYDGRLVPNAGDYRSSGVTEARDGSKRLSAWLESSSELGEKDYIVKLEGHAPGRSPETIEEYYFHVRRGKQESGKKP